jgi:hypothetical protein
MPLLSIVWFSVHGWHADVTIFSVSSTSFYLSLSCLEILPGVCTLFWVSGSIFSYSPSLFSRLYIQLEKNTCAPYFGHIVTIERYNFKSNDIFWKPVEFSTILYIYIFVCTDILKNKSSEIRTPSSLDSHRLDYVIVLPISFLSFLSL